MKRMCAHALSAVLFPANRTIDQNAPNLLQKVDYFAQIAIYQPLEIA